MTTQPFPPVPTAVSRQPGESALPDLGSQVLSILILWGVLVLLLCWPREGWSLDRNDVRQIVIEEALELQLPLSLALAVAHAESFFNPKAESPKGARGVMQIMPATARGEYGIHADHLWHPRLNIRTGLHFLKQLLNRYDGRVALALSYYNGGSKVGDLPNAHILPATRPYVKRVWELQGHYHQWLKEEFG